MNRKIFISTCAAILLSAFAVSAAQASVVGISNLINPSPGALGLNTTGATSFTTGTGSGWSLDSVTLGLDTFSAADVTVSIYNDATYTNALGDYSAPGTDLSSGGVSVNVNGSTLLRCRSATPAFPWPTAADLVPRPAPVL